MTDCISDKKSMKYLNGMKKNGVSVYVSTSQTDYLRPYGSRLRPGRSLDSKTRMFFEMWRSLGNIKKWPALIPINTILNDNGDKHSLMMVISTPIGHEGEMFRIEVFDSNGPLASGPDQPEWDWHPKYGARVWDIVSRMAEMMQGKHKVPVTVVNVLDHSVNNVGHGHCDALSIYYGAMRVAGTSMEELRIIMNPGISEDDIKQLNSYISTGSPSLSELTQFISEDNPPAPAPPQSTFHF